MAREHDSDMHTLVSLQEFVHCEETLLLCYIPRDWTTYGDTNTQ